MRGNALYWRVFVRICPLLALPSLGLAGLLLYSFGPDPHAPEGIPARDLQAVIDRLHREPGAATLQAGPDYNALAEELGELAEGHVRIFRLDGTLLGDSRSGPDASGAPDSLALHANRRIAGRPVVSNGRAYGLVTVVKTVPGGQWGQRVFPTLLVVLVVSVAAAAAAAKLITGLYERRAYVVAAQAAQLGGGESLASPFLGQRDSFERLTGEIRDAGRRFERLIASSEERKRQWEHLFSAMREGVLVVDHEGRVGSMNRAAKLAFGVEEAFDPVGRPLFEVVRNRELMRFVDQLQEGVADMLNTELFLEDDETRDDHCYRLSGVRMTPEDDGEVRVLAVMHDITRLKQLENMRKEFVANVSHELKTPLTTVKGYVETLEDCLQADDPEHARHFIGIISAETDRMNAIINDLLSLARLEQGGDEAINAFTEADLRDTIHDAVGNCEHQRRQHRVVIDEDLPDDCPYVGNHRLLAQAIGNLLDNAIKYSPDESQVTIRLTAVDEMVEISVTDQGRGVPREHHERIFERFYRVDKSRDRQTGGTGLGLSIVKHIVRLHGGNVRVSSQPGQGSCFTISLPRSHAAGDSARAPGSAATA